MSWYEKDKNPTKESNELPAEIVDESISIKNSNGDSIKPSFSQELINECQAFVASLSDAVKFSYVGLCATTLHMLYGDHNFLLVGL